MFRFQKLQKKDEYNEHRFYMTKTYFLIPLHTCEHCFHSTYEIETTEWDFYLEILDYDDYLKFIFDEIETM